MGLAVIPTDWTAGYIELCIQWPDSPEWLAILRGQLNSPNDTDFWDPFTGDPEEPKTAIEPTIDQNLHPEECMIIPPGLIAPYGDSAAPIGWLECNGGAVSREDYAALFNAIGTFYGPGDGSTTFNLPDGRGRVLVGLDASIPDFDTMGEKHGEKDHTLTTSEMPSHTHVQNAHTHIQNSHTHTVFGNMAGAAGIDRRTLAATTGNDVTSAPSTPTNQNATPTNQNTGAGSSHNNMPPFIVIQYIIKT